MSWMTLISSLMGSVPTRSFSRSADHVMASWRVAVGGSSCMRPKLISTGFLFSAHSVV